MKSRLTVGLPTLSSLPFIDCSTAAVNSPMRPFQASPKCSRFANPKPMTMATTAFTRLMQTSLMPFLPVMCVRISASNTAKKIIGVASALSRSINILLAAPNAFSVLICVLPNITPTSIPSSAPARMR